MMYNQTGFVALLACSFTLKKIFLFKAFLFLKIHCRLHKKSLGCTLLSSGFTQNSFSIRWTATLYQCFVEHRGEGSTLAKTRSNYLQNYAEIVSIQNFVFVQWQGRCQAVLYTFLDTQFFLILPEIFKYLNRARAVSLTPKKLRTP